MFRLLAILVMLAVVTSCSDAPETGANDNTTTSTPTTAPVVTTTTTPPSTAQQTSPCLSGDHPFSSSGIISAFGGASGDAAQISGLKADRHPGCERIVLDLLTADGAPAGSLGLVGVEYDAETGIVRINLPRSVSRTSVADLRFDGELANRAYVVQTADGNLALDLHVVAGSSVALRAFEVTAPTRIVIDLKTDPDLPAVVGAVSNDYVVVTSPGPGSGGTPLVVEGYARPGLSEVEARMHDHAEGEALVAASAAVSASDEAWGEFLLRIVDPPSGSHELFIGESAVRDDPAGVWISIDTGPAEELGKDDA